MYTISCSLHYQKQLPQSLPLLRGSFSELHGITTVLRPSGPFYVYHLIQSNLLNNYGTMGVKKKNFQKEEGQPPPNSAPRDRFDASRPQFHKTSSKDAKVELDDRFTSLLSDPNFQVQIVDKYGRNQKGLRKENSMEELGKFYTVKDGSDVRRHNDLVTSPCSDLAEHAGSTLFKRDGSKQEASHQDNINKNKISEEPTTRIAYLTALSRGEVDFSSSEEEEKMAIADEHGESDDDDYPNMQPESDTVGVLDPSFKAVEDMPVEFTTVESPYLAVTNADWSHLRAVDFFAIFSSFVPLGMVLRVTVYPSNFGVERLGKEELFGPVDVWTSNSKCTDLSCVDVNCENEGNSDRINDNQNDCVLDDTNEFNPEKLRLYEASRLKYFFAVVEFVNAGFADVAYKEIDGMEFEHSSAALDLRIIPVAELSNIIANRKMRDEATALPSSYNPPDFVVNALQQSTVQCTWDIGDQNREALLTKYSVSGQSWETIAENEDLKMYLGSDQSSDGDESNLGKKSSKLRNMLGLQSDTDDSSEMDSKNESTDEQVSDGESSYVKQASFIPGKLDGTNVSDEPENERTPWEKFKEKRRQKRREKRTAVREKRRQVNDERKGHSRVGESECNNDFFVGNGNETPNTDLNLLQSGKSEAKFNESYLVGSIDDEKRDFDMRGLERMEKNKLKQLKGARKRKEDRFAASVAGTEFQVNAFDERFIKVLEGTDERFGIDRTDPNFKETPAMQHILDEQSRHRKKYRNALKAGLPDQIADDTVDATKNSLSRKSGTAALSALVVNIKANINS
jgi:hypothetical protein